MLCPDFWPAFFAINAALVFGWSLVRYRDWGIDGERTRVKTMGFSVLLLCLAAASYWAAHTRLEWVP